LLDFDVELPRHLPPPRPDAVHRPDPLLEFTPEAPGGARSQPDVLSQAVFAPSSAEWPLLRAAETAHVIPRRSPRRGVMATVRESLHLPLHLPEGHVLGAEPLVRRGRQPFGNPFQPTARMRLAALCAVAALATLLIGVTTGALRENDPSPAPSSSERTVVTDPVALPSRPVAAGAAGGGGVSPSSGQRSERTVPGTTPVRQERAASRTAQSATASPPATPVPTPVATPSAPARPARTAAARTTAAASAQTQGFRGSLQVDSNPPGARVIFNGRIVGTTPVAIRDLPAGSGVLRLELAGHAPWSSSVRVVANQQTRIHTDLRASAP
jgi:hypothetical protein